VDIFVVGSVNIYDIYILNSLQWWIKSENTKLSNCATPFMQQGIYNWTYWKMRHYNVNPFPDEELILDERRAKTSLPFLFTFYILFRMQSDQPTSSSSADHFASYTNYRKWTKIANLLGFAHQNSSKYISIKMLFVR